MITSRSPEDWRALQREVARILTECGMSAEQEKIVELARGQAEIDVHAVELVHGRPSTVFCECKLWNKAISQHVVHAFRTIVADGGANVGYVITSSDFQSGAFAAADLTNVRLVTWQQFQDEFEPLWVERFLRPEITARLDRLMTLVEPLAPPGFSRLSDAGRKRYLEVRERYFELGALAILFSTYAAVLAPEIPDLPLAGGHASDSASSTLPAEILDATAYREALELMVAMGERGVRELEGVLNSE